MIVKDTKIILNMQPIHANFTSMVLKLYIYLYYDSLKYKKKLDMQPNHTNFMSCVLWLYMP